VWVSMFSAEISMSKSDTIVNSHCSGKRDPLASLSSLKRCKRVSYWGRRKVRDWWAPPDCSDSASRKVLEVNQSGSWKGKGMRLHLTSVLSIYLALLAPFHLNDSIMFIHLSCTVFGRAEANSKEIHFVLKWGRANSLRRQWVFRFHGRETDRMWEAQRTSGSMVAVSRWSWGWSGQNCHHQCLA
jgi:hypothetical protein